LKVEGKQTIEFDDLFIGYSPYIEPEVIVSEVEQLEEENETYKITEVETQPIRNGYGPKIKDIDGNIYKTVYIGTQHWMAENLKVSKYNDNSPLINLISNKEWANPKGGGWCHYDNNAGNDLKYGKLYNWYTVSTTSNGNKNICPSGWRIPTETDWMIFSDYLGGEDAAKMKTKGAKIWPQHNYKTTNSSLFSALPGGSRGFFGDFGGIGNSGYWWLSEEFHTYAQYYSLDGATYQHHLNDDKRCGFSIRCIKD
jgi:uncharacterized protein (TIGR02145 family)